MRRFLRESLQESPNKLLQKSLEEFLQEYVKKSFGSESLDTWRNSCMNSRRNPFRNF